MDVERPPADTVTHTKLAKSSEQPVVIADATDPQRWTGDDEHSMSNPDRSRVVHLAEARARIPGPGGEHAVSVLQRNSLSVKLSLPVLPNQQTPHTQDEIYVIIQGRGVLCHDDKRDAFEPGDLMFVTAGTEHRFEEFTEDLALWVVFYGPPGGEVSA
jgi:mannose-6-phosphate isomerase-like protein (cupin superfamily)